jgi:hypothetical protein
VFAQAKCKRGATQVAASALYDVCAQANKNLGYLRYGGGEMPGRSRKWATPWKGGPKDSTYKVSPRIRRGPTAAAAFLGELNAILPKPGTRREMWLVLGKTLSKKEFREELTSRKPPASAIQTFYLLMTAHSACKSVGSNFGYSVHRELARSAQWCEEIGGGKFGDSTGSHGTGRQSVPVGY